MRPNISHPPTQSSVDTKGTPKPPSGESQLHGVLGKNLASYHWHRSTLQGQCHGCSTQPVECATIASKRQQQQSSGDSVTPLTFNEQFQSLSLKLFPLNNTQFSFESVRKSKSALGHPHQNGNWKSNEPLLFFYVIMSIIRQWYCFFFFLREHKSQTQKPCCSLAISKLAEPLIFLWSQITPFRCQGYIQ